MKSQLSLFLLKVTHFKCGVYGIPMTGADRVLPQCLTNSSNVLSVSGSSFGPTNFLIQISDTAMLIRLFHVILYSPLGFGRNTHSWKCYGISSLDFHINAGLPWARGDRSPHDWLRTRIHKKRRKG